MDRLKILKYIYAVNETGKVTRVEVEEYQTMRNYIMLFVKNVGLITFHGGKPTEKNGITYFLKPEYIKHQYTAQNTAFKKELERLHSVKSYHYNEWQGAIERIKTLKNQASDIDELYTFMKEDKEAIGQYHIENSRIKE